MKKNITERISGYSGSQFAVSHIVHTSPTPDMFSVHTHDMCEIILVKSGHVSASFDAKTYPLKKDSLIIFRPNIPHRIQIDGSSAYERYNIVFDERQLANGAFYRIPETVEIIDCSGNSMITGLFGKFDYYSKAFDDTDTGALYKNVLEEIIYCLTVIPFGDTSESFTSAHPVIRRAVEYISERFTENITVDSICREIGVTKSYLHHLFNDTLQMTPKKYINLKRLSKARSLIRMGESPISVYLDCGFENYSTFFRNFKAMFGYAPSEESGAATETIIID